MKVFLEAFKFLQLGFAFFCRKEIGVKTAGTMLVKLNTVKNEKKVSDKPAKKKDFLFDKEEDENDLDDDDDSEDTKKDKKKVNVKVTNFSHAKISGLPVSLER